MTYLSTRNKNISVTGSQALLQGLSDDGGLFVPASFPVFSENELKTLCRKSYPELLAEILYKFLPEFSKDELVKIGRQSIEKFENEITASLVRVNEDGYFLELWHGPTHAFKDAALTVLPHLMTAAARKAGIDKKILILVATSGDTGKAALEGFCDVKGVKIMTIYPFDGVSEIQKLQMTTQKGGNVNVLGIKGNFDDAQTAVKAIFTSAEMKEKINDKGYLLSSANSINLGRLLPQIVYYFSAYFDLVENDEIIFGERINYVVPSGNFGNILAAYYARRMGLPISRLIVASNKNNVLTDFFNTGTYNTDRNFYKTVSPSMDILISSNLERLIFEITERDSDRTAELMRNLSEKKSYSLTETEFAKVKDIFYGEYATDEEALQTIGNLFEDCGYLIDPHTAVALNCYDNYVANTEDCTKTVIVSTASPYKFIDEVLKALNLKPGKTILHSFRKIYDETALEVPESLIDLFNADEIFTKVADKKDIADEVLKFIK